MSKIVTIHGEDCDPRKAADTVVEALKYMLERAEAGQITGLVAIALEFDGSTGSCISGQARCNAVVGSMFRTLNELARDIS